MFKLQIFRLLRYLNGESSLDDFGTINENYQNLNNQTETNKMDSKKPYIKPDTFSGSTSENIDSFLKKYDRAAKINGWTTEDKAQYIVAFLEGPALTFYENSQHNNIDIPKMGRTRKNLSN